jgi:hypothetical protein
VHRAPPLSELLIAPEPRRGGWLDWLPLQRLFQR